MATSNSQRRTATSYKLIPAAAFCAKNAVNRRRTWSIFDWKFQCSMQIRRHSKRTMAQWLRDPDAFHSAGHDLWNRHLGFRTPQDHTAGPLRLIRHPTWCSVRSIRGGFQQTYATLFGWLPRAITEFAYQVQQETCPDSTVSFNVCCIVTPEKIEKQIIIKLVRIYMFFFFGGGWL